MRFNKDLAIIIGSNKIFIIFLFNLGDKPAYLPLHLFNCPAIQFQKFKRDILTMQGNIMLVKTIPEYSFKDILVVSRTSQSTTNANWQYEF